MKAQIHYLILSIAFLAFVVSASAQYEPRGKEFNYEDAESFYNAGNYYDALALYEILTNENPKVIEYQLKIGICHLHLTVSPEKAIEYIEEVYNKKPKTEDVQYYLGKAYALNYKFDLAIKMFEKALNNVKNSSESKKEIPLFMQQCENAKLLIKDSIKLINSIIFVSV